MLAIKLKRIGKKKQTSFRVIVSEKRSKLNGRYVEDLGFWNPHTNKASLNKERATYWLEHGAEATPTVHNLFVKREVVKGEKIAVINKKKERKKK